MRTPIVIIQTGTSLEAFADEIQYSIDQRFHSYRLSPECERMSHGMSEGQIGQIETTTAIAAHAAGDQHDSRLYVNGVHLERLIA